MDIACRIKQLMNERGMTIYTLAQRSGVSWNTIKNILVRESTTTVATLEQLCKGLGISVAQFFDDSGETVQLTAEQQHLLSRWSIVSDEERKIISDMLDVMVGKHQ